RANADFVGYKYGDDLVAMYRAMQFLLIPTRSDTLGLVLLEAAACGTPAVALRGTVAADLISRYGSGVVVDDFDDSVFQLLHNVARSDQFKRLRARAKAMAADHDVSVGTTILVNTWLDACHPRNIAKRTAVEDPAPPAAGAAPARPEEARYGRGHD